MNAALKHFQDSSEALQRQDWERSIGKGGQFIEAVLKAMSLHTGGVLPPARQFKAANVIRDLKQLPIGSFSDALRITIPRACEFAYDIASNRGARHDPDEINPNEMDATGVFSTISWILAELVRYSEKGAVSSEETKDLVSGIIQRRYPVVEDIEGRVYFHIGGLSARQAAILTLWHQHPRRMNRSGLISAVQRNGFSATNANMAIARIANVIDVDEHGGLRLLGPGLREAEELVKSAEE